jgi:hypothetical protein
MPTQAQLDLMLAICKFATLGRHFPLREFQHMAGWVNWALNIYPLLCPVLCKDEQENASAPTNLGEQVHLQRIRVGRLQCRGVRWSPHDGCH